MSFLIDKYDVYLTKEALEAIELLTTQHSLDKDLAVALLESLWPEDAIYFLPVEN